VTRSNLQRLFDGNEEAYRKGGRNNCSRGSSMGNKSKVKQTWETGYKRKAKAREDGQVGAQGGGAFSEAWKDQTAVRSRRNNWVPRYRAKGIQE